MSQASVFKEVEVMESRWKLEPDLKRILGQLADQDKMEVLIYPKQMAEGIERFVDGVTESR